MTNVKTIDGQMQIINEAGIQVNKADQAAFREHVEKGYDRYAAIVGQANAKDLIAKLKAVGGY